MKIFLSIEPPTVTAQMKRVRVCNGKPMFYDSPKLKEARALFLKLLTPPAAPLEGPVSLRVFWYFRTKTHKEGSYRITRPDTDNLQKLLKDCMTEAGFWKDDAQVCVEYVSKFWTREVPGILIEVTKPE